MREIKFRGYSEKMKIWCYGYYVEQSGYSYIVDFDTICETTKDFRDVFENLSWSLVDEKSVGQFTGLKDKNGKEIYEGDIVCYVEDVVVDSEGGFNRTEPEGRIGSVEFSNGAYWVNAMEFDFYAYGEQIFLWSELEIIGNIYENPELLN